MQVIMSHMTLNIHTVPMFQYVYVFYNSNNPSEFIFSSNEFTEYGKDQPVPFNEFIEFFKTKFNTYENLN